MKCDKCKKDFPEVKCHNILPSIIWKYVPNDLKHKCKNAIRNFTFKYIGEKREDGKS